LHRQRDARPRVRYVLGLMAGTSGDGIDAACVEVRGTGTAMRCALVLHHHRPYPAALRRRVLAMMAPAATSTEQLARLHAELGEAFGRVACEAIDWLPVAQRPTLVGLAGQTVCHLPGNARRRTVTLQLGDAARVAAQTGLVTVADFRQADVAVGGQGAPLVPWTDWVLFGRSRVARIVLNIGGIANLTWLPAGGGEEDVTAFDTGPGNMVIDALMRHVTAGRRQMDRDGRCAGRGRVLEGVLAMWLQHPYFRKRPPKSTGREIFGQPFVDGQLTFLKRASRSSDDWIATATALTARSVARACRRFLPLPRTAPGRSTSRACCELIVAGGGARNATLLSMLAAELPCVKVVSIDTFGIDAQAKEAMSFAMLAAARIDNVSACLPQVTGATARPLLGHVSVPASACR